MHTQNIHTKMTLESHGKLLKERVKPIDIQFKDLSYQVQVHKGMYVCMSVCPQIQPSFETRHHQSQCSLN